MLLMCFGTTVNVIKVVAFFLSPRKDTERIFLGELTKNAHL